MSPETTDTEQRGPSIHAPGDPHYTYDDLAADTPGGVLAADPTATAMNAKDAEIAELRAKLDEATGTKTDPEVEV